MRPDACPGALQVHEAADGGLARVRVPGGRLAPAQADAIADCAESLGSGVVELTSRANLQVRGLRDTEAFAARMAEAGLLPSPTHERVRNIIASPYAGRGPTGSADVTPLVEALDHALCADPRLAALPGRFLFAVDDGSGDVAALGADVTSTPAGLLIAGLPVRFPPSATTGTTTTNAATPTATGTGTTTGTGAATSTDDDAAATATATATATAGKMVAAALAFLEERRRPPRPPLDAEGELPRNCRSGARDAAFVEQDGGSSPDATAWRITELTNGPARIAARLGGSLTPQDTPTPPSTPAPAPSGTPSAAPSGTPSATPSDTPSAAPSDTPSTPPSGTPSTAPTRTPTPAPSGTPSAAPTGTAGTTPTGTPAAPSGVRRAGVTEQRDGRVALEVLVPLGRLSPGQLRALAQAPGRVVLTPWRSVILLDLGPSAAEAEAGRLADAGLVTDPGSPWAGVTACTGSPGCAKSRTDVRADATRWVAGLTDPPGTPVHWAGCERRCGRPRGEVLERIATGDGYLERHT